MSAQAGEEDFPHRNDRFHLSRWLSYNSVNFNRINYKEKIEEVVKIN